jgi:hypothetical protein
MAAADVTERVEWSRDEAIAAIRKALRARSGLTWSVTGGRGTGWGWITITAPPARRTAHGDMTDDDARQLHAMLGLPNRSRQFVLVPASAAHRREYVARAEGLPVTATPAYWD